MEPNTNNELIPVNRKLEALLQKETLAPDEIDNLAGDERKQFISMINQRLQSNTGDELAGFREKILPAVENMNRLMTWEENHTNIASAIHNLINKNNRMPSKTEIAEETGLSRETVRKHLEIYRKHPLFKENEEQYKIVKDNMLVNLYRMSSNGDVRAAKLYFEATGMLGNGSGANKNIIQNQNNYIQFNETSFSLEQIKKLSPEKLQQIEALLSGWILGEKKPENTQTIDNQ